MVPNAKFLSFAYYAFEGILRPFTYQRTAEMFPAFQKRIPRHIFHFLLHTFSTQSTSLDVTSRLVATREKLPVIKQRWHIRLYAVTVLKSLQLETDVIPGRACDFLGHYAGDFLVNPMPRYSRSLLPVVRFLMSSNYSNSPFRETGDYIRM